MRYLPIALAALLLAHQSVKALLFAPQHYGLWDQTGLIHQGTWMVWYDAQNGSSTAIGFGLATSVDGLHCGCLPGLPASAAGL